MTYKILKLTLGLLLISTLTACDNYIFNQFFRNPYIVEIAELDNMDANKWYEFETEAKALNRDQEIVVYFDGGKSKYLSYKDVGDTTFYISKKYPGETISFDVLVIDDLNKEHVFKASGQGLGILYVDKDGGKMTGRVIKKVKIKGNLNFNDVKITWISSTGK